MAVQKLLLPQPVRFQIVLNLSFLRHKLRTIEFGNNLARRNAIPRPDEYGLDCPVDRRLDVPPMSRLNHTSRRNCNIHFCHHN